jgi:ABC-type nitrate/sulfonate/bicarbonate transport system permease component
LTVTDGTDLGRVEGALGQVPTGPTPPRGDRPEGRGMPSWLGGLIGTLILLAIWWILAVTYFHKVGSGVPRPNDVATKLWHDLSSGLYWPNIRQTLKEAIEGYVGAVILAFVLAIAFVQIPIVEKVLLRLAVASYCIPIIAIGPILVFALPGDRPKAVLAGLLVFFPTLVGVVLGLRSTDKASLDVIRAAGGGKWAQLTKVRWRAALPSTFAALQIAAPSAVLGAIIGDLLGGQQGNGLGIMMVDSEQALDIPRTWGIAIVCTTVAGLAYLIIGAVGRMSTTWAPRKPGR